MADLNNVNVALVIVDWQTSEDEHFGKDLINKRQLVKDTTSVNY